MLERIANCSLPADFIILSDKIEAKGYNLFVAFLNNIVKANGIKIIKLICTENSPYFYIKCIKSCEKIHALNYFSDPCGWNEELETKLSLETCIDFQNISLETAIFIDSLHPLFVHNGFFAVYKELFKLKKLFRKIVCLVHSELLSEENLLELKYLSSSFIGLENFSGTSDGTENKFHKEKLVDLTYKKPGGKIIIEKEIVFINEDFEIVSKSISNEKTIREKQRKGDIKNLTTFKLNFQMSDNEKNAKSQLVLPYLKDTEKSNVCGTIVYDIEAEDLEDDPDEDLDI